MKTTGEGTGQAAEDDLPGTYEEPEREALQTMVVDGKFREPDGAYVDLLNAVEDPSERLKLSVIYALELVGAIRTSESLSHALGRIKARIPKKPSKYNYGNQGRYEQLEAHYQNTIRLLGRELDDIEKKILLPRQDIDAAIRVDQLHDEDTRAIILDMAETNGVLEAPCFAELEAMELDPDTKARATQVLAMMALSEIQHLTPPRFVPGEIDNTEVG